MRASERLPPDKVAADVAEGVVEVVAEEDVETVARRRAEDVVEAVEAVEAAEVVVAAVTGSGRVAIGRIARTSSFLKKNN